MAGKIIRLGAEPKLDGERELKRILGELAGHASLCWSIPPTGIFDSTQATVAVNQAFNEIIDLLKKF